YTTLSRSGKSPFERSPRRLENPADLRIRRVGDQLLDLRDDTIECLLHRQDRDLCLLGVRILVLVGDHESETVGTRVRVPMRLPQLTDHTSKCVAECFEDVVGIGRPVTPLNCGRLGVALARISE